MGVYNMQIAINLSV